MKGYVGDFAVGSTVNLYFSTNDGSGGAVDFSATIELADFDIYKNVSTTQRSSTAGWTLDQSHDAITGISSLSIDLSNNTDADFYEKGSDYVVIMTPDETVDGQTVAAIIGAFSIENRFAPITEQVGSARNFEATADNTSGAIIDGVTIVGSITANLFTDTEVENGVRHQLTHSANAFDFVYKVPVGGARVGVGIEWIGYLTSNNDVCSLQVYDHVGSTWDTRDTITGRNQAVNSTHEVKLLGKHTGTGSELGNVYIRFVTTGQSAPVLNTDLLLVQAQNIGQSVGYANGQIWIDTLTGVAGTEPFVNGTADNHVLTLADAKTMAPGLGIEDFHIINGSSITLAESTAHESYFGDNWALALGGQNIIGAYIQGATVTGVGTSSSEVHFEGCDVGTCSVQKAHFDFCGFSGTVTQTLAGDYEYHNCYDKGDTTAVFTKTPGQTITMEFVNWSGAITINGLEAGDTVILAGTEIGDVILAGADGTVDVHGIYKSITDNRTGSPTLTITGAIKASGIALASVCTEARLAELDPENMPGDLDTFGAIALAILSDTNELQTDWKDTGRLDVILDARMAETSISTTGGAVDTVTTVGTTTTNTDMRGTDNAALASVCTEARLAELAAANLPADVDAILLDTGTDGVVISSATADAIALALLKLNWDGITGEAARSALNALRVLRNLVDITGSAMSVKKEDDSTEAWAATVTTDANAKAITRVAPTT